MYDIEQQLAAVGNAACQNLNQDELYDAICALLDNPDFCPEGGLLGFTLVSEYQVHPGQDLDEVLESLEGDDVAIRWICHHYGLTSSVKTVLRDCTSSDIWHESWNGGLGLLNRAVEVSDPLDLDISLLQYFLDDPDRGAHVQLIHPYDDEPCYRCSTHGESSEPIAWVRPVEDNQLGYQLDGVSYQGAPVREWVGVGLIASFGPAGNRITRAA
ncbi:hypothetical protein L218DRAFT_1006810 [Marasmius fiardii PR-910]|nr:hypothetical protein L218DRAFT_1006810 [Marasmius fiardii PR-910]